jgi:LDH2 family malate/lactate/ureidoglycolate dehydrogenase
VLLPFGGHKGYGLALLIDVLTAALTGAPIGRSVNQRDTNAEEHGQSLLMLAIDPSRFVPIEDYLARVDQLVREVHATPPAEGFKEVVVPGDLELRQESERRQKGIPFFAEDWDAMVGALEQAGLPAKELAARFAPTEE